MKKKLIFRFFIYIIIKTKSKMSNNTYDIALTIEEAKEFHLLDEIKFKYFSDYCEDDIIYGTADYDIRSEDTPQWENEVNIKLEFNWYGGDSWSSKEKTHEVEIYKKYNTSSPFAMKMLDWNNEEEEEESEWVNGVIPKCEKCGIKFNENGNNYNEKDGEEICNDCEEELTYHETLKQETEEQCKMCSKQNEMVLSLDKDEDPKCNECGDKYEWNETDMSYSKKI